MGDDDVEEENILNIEALSKMNNIANAKVNLLNYSLKLFETIQNTQFKFKEYI